MGIFFRRRRPRIHYYACAYNDAALLPFTLRHYAPWVERFVIYDLDSTDETMALLDRTPAVEVRRLPWTHFDSVTETIRSLHDSCWKDSRGEADWVIVADVDEFLYHPDFGAYLSRGTKRQVTCIPALGYEMVSDHFPNAGATLHKAVCNGVPQRMMNKLRLFDPNAIDETNFGPGGHDARPTGKVIYPKRDELLLLHYKWLGLEYLTRRYALLNAMRRDGDIANKWAHHYTVPPAALAANLDSLRASAVDVLALGERAWQDHREHRWWRRPVGTSVKQ